MIISQKYLPVLVLVLSLVEISPLVLEKIMKMGKHFDQESSQACQVGCPNQHNLNNIFTLLNRHPKRNIFSIVDHTLFSSPELKAQISFSDPLLSVICLSVCPSVCKLFTFSSSSQETTRPISTKLGTKHPWVLGIQVCSNEGPSPFLNGDNKEIGKIQ